jgi:Resolvase, N terminal domain
VCPMLAFQTDTASPQTVGTAGFEPATTRPPAECATRLRHVPTRLYRDLDNTRLGPCYHAISVALAASYIRTDTEGELPTRDEQMAEILAHAANDHELVAHYEDLAAPGLLLYHRQGIKEAINNIKELEDWEVLVVAEPRCISDTESALHEFVHKLSLYGNRLESPTRTWEEFLADMRSYRRAMSRK